MLEHERKTNREQHPLLLQYHHVTIIRQKKSLILFIFIDSIICSRLVLQYSQNILYHHWQRKRFGEIRHWYSTTTLPSRYASIGRVKWLEVNYKLKAKMQVAFMIHACKYEFLTEVLLRYSYKTLGHCHHSRPHPLLSCTSFQHG